MNRGYRLSLLVKHPKLWNTVVENGYREGRPDSKHLNNVCLKKLACQTYQKSDPNLRWGAEE